MSRADALTLLAALALLTIGVWMLRLGALHALN